MPLFLEDLRMASTKITKALAEPVILALNRRYISREHAHASSTWTCILPDGWQRTSFHQLYRLKNQR